MLSGKEKLKGWGGGGPEDKVESLARRPEINKCPTGERAGTYLACPSGPILRRGSAAPPPDLRRGL